MMRCAQMKIKGKASTHLRKNRGRRFQSLGKWKPWPKSIFIKSFLDDGELSDNQGHKASLAWPRVVLICLDLGFDPCSMIF